MLAIAPHSIASVLTSANASNYAHSAPLEVARFPGLPIVSRTSTVEVDANNDRPLAAHWAEDR